MRRETMMAKHRQEHEVYAKKGSGSNGLTGAIHRLLK